MVSVLTFVALLDSGNLIVILRTNIVRLFQIAFTFLMPFENSESGTPSSDVHCGIMVRKSIARIAIINNGKEGKTFFIFWKLGCD
jgi:hypothetical protein